MGNRILISEQERNEIKNLHLLNENFIGKLLNKFKNSKIYKSVEKAFHENPRTFVQNIVKEIPKLEKVEGELEKRITNVSKMSDEEKQKYLKDNNVDLEKNIDSAEKEINEQTQMGAGGAAATGGGISIGSIFMVLLVVVLIYILVGLATEKKRKAKKEAEKEIERQRIEKEKLRYKEQNDKLKNTFLNKTLNLYNDSNQQSINSDFSPFVITDIEFRQVNEGLKGVVIKGNSKQSIEGMIGGDLVASCKTNPDEFNSSMGVFSLDINNARVSEPINKKTFYNKAFTDKLNEIGSQWCAKPKADFGYRKGGEDYSNLA